MTNQIERGRMITLQTAADAYRKLGDKVAFSKFGVHFNDELMTDKDFLIMAMSDFQVA